MTPPNSKLIALDELCGTKLSSGSSMERVIKDAGLDFAVERVPAYNPEGAQISTTRWVNRAKYGEEPDWVEKKEPLFFFLRRADNKHPLGMVRKRYVPIPMEKMLEPFHAMVGEFKAQYETAGIIDGGRKVWVAAKLPHGIKLEHRPDDVTDFRIMLLLSQDGMRRNAFFTLAKRIYCNNQFHVIAKAARNSEYSVKHSKNWEQYLKVARNNFEEACRNASQFNEIANELDKREMSMRDMEHFSEVLIPRKEEETTRTTDRRTQLIQLFETGAGNRGKTRWDAFNAVTEFLDHHNGVGRLSRGTSTMQQAAAERRMVSNMLGGPGDIMKNHALKILMRTPKFTRATMLASAMN